MLLVNGVRPCEGPAYCVSICSVVILEVASYFAKPRLYMARGMFVISTVRSPRRHEGGDSAARIENICP